MGKDRKTKKGNREEELDDESSNISDQPMKSKNKKGRRNKDEDTWEEASESTKPLDVTEKESQEGTTKKKKDKKKGKTQSISDDEGVKNLSSDEDSVSVKPKRNQKKKKKRDDDFDDELILVSELKKVEISKPKVKKPQGRSVFEFLNDEGSDIDMNSGDENETELEKTVEAVKMDEKAEKSKKTRKERKKKDDDDDEELERMLAEIEGKRDEDEDAMEDLEEKMAIVVTEIPEEEEDEKKSKKKKKKKKEAVVEDQIKDKDTAEVDDADEGGTLKSAAQKKKEKKERERLKKLASNAQDKGKKKVEVSEKPVIDGKPSGDAGNETKDILDDEEVDEDAKNKKKDKSKKKKEEKEDKDKKRPGKRQILAMQEALKRLKDEEDKARLEEEAREKAAEEAENLRLEKLRLDQERKERKKQKEKEKRERLKAEGKLLTQAQKQQRARAQAMLESLRAQGLDVPKIGEKKERTPRPGDRIRPKKSKTISAVEDESKMDVSNEPKSELSSESIAVSSEGKTPRDDEQTALQLPEEPEEVKNAWDQESTGDVKDSWDISSSEEEDEDEKPSRKAGNKKSLGKKKSDSVDEGSESESESDESESESDDDDSSGESESEEEEQKPASERLRERAITRIEKRREENEKNRSVAKLRSPVVCVLGHVDTGKTKILDKIRHTHVQDSEAGGITQQIGATMVPMDAIREQSKMAKSFLNCETKIPGLLIIDTPGHESFSNLRSRGSSLCDIAILVVDIMHGLEPQTIESINLLKLKKTPFVVALNKIDRLYEWKPNKHKDVQDTLKGQNRNTQLEFDERVKSVVLQFAEQSLNVKLFYENDDPRTFVSLVPTSAHTGDGMGNLMALIVELTQTMMAKQISYSDELQATVLEEDVAKELQAAMSSIKLAERGVYVQASTLGSLEALI
uniref:Tr-type G domain-containing protein n=1 Tax=Strigamia maritima TaxID=126957 RepID=T1IU62_STRMM